ncbi:MAG: flagellar basal body P-ring formation chaperone FlgA [Longimicrobiales bacterium]
MRCWVALPVLLASGAGAHAAAQEPTYPSSVERRARDEVARRWQTSGDSLVLEWSRVREDVAEDSPVDLVGSGAGGHWVARLRTVDGSPVSIRLRAGERRSVPVAARGLSRGQELTPSDVSVTTEVRWGAPEPGGEAVDLEGWVVQRAIASGEALRLPVVRPPLAVVSGRGVEIRWQRGGVGLTASATAAGSAAVGDTVFVRTQSGERLRGVAVAPGIVDVSREGGR